MRINQFSLNHNKNHSLSRRLAFAICCALAVAVHAQSGNAGPSCLAHSGSERAALVELYTSEGCSSCPPADRWLASLPGTGVEQSWVVALAFHVDYWDYLGWRDPFASAAFSARQRAHAARVGARFVYTPQILVNGLDVRTPWISDAFRSEVKRIHLLDSPVDLQLESRLQAKQVKIRLEARQRHSGTYDAYVALTQNNLTSRVRSGENAGTTLHHQNVVRRLWGPFSIHETAPVDAGLVALPPEQGRIEDLRVSAFVQNSTSGEVVQAISAGVCAGQ